METDEVRDLEWFMERAQKQIAHDTKIYNLLGRMYVYLNEREDLSMSGRVLKEDVVAAMENWGIA